MTKANVGYRRSKAYCRNQHTSPPLCKGGFWGNVVELSTLTNQIVGRQPFAAETNRVPSRHGDADLLLNSTALGLGGISWSPSLEPMACAA